MGREGVAACSSEESCFAVERDMITHPTEPIAHQRQGLVSLHPKVYGILGAMALLFVIAAWTFFGNAKYAGMVLVVVTLFIGFAIAIVADIAHIWHDHHDPAEDPGEPTESFHEWLRHPVKLEWGTVSGKHAAFMAALPIVAAGACMVALAAIRLTEIG
jgi:amino acid transporter